MLLSEYLKMTKEFDKKVFDPVLDEDSPFFINLQRLKRTTVPEFVESYEKIHDFFRKIIKLLDKAKSKDDSDVFYKQAVKMFHFSEVNGLCLGYAKGNIGAGFGPKISRQVISTAYDIVKAGIEDPEFFELLPLFQENVGADRISDMIATLILDDIKEYTKRKNIELGIIEDNYNKYEFKDDLLYNPYKKTDVLLVPIEILHRLPVAKCWEDIDDVVSENSTIRMEMNSEVANSWKKYSSKERKLYLKNTIFVNADTCGRVLNSYRKEELDVIDPNENFEYFLLKLWQKIESLNLDMKSKSKYVDSYIASKEILDIFKQWVENNKGWEVIQDASSKKREKILQRIIHLDGLSYKKSNNLDINCEPDAGRGPVDFKVSRGEDITIIEVKLSSSNQYLHGYEKQIEEYGKAEQTDKMIYVLVDLGNPIRVKTIQELHDNRINQGEKTPDLIIIDAKPKMSASKYDD